MKKLSIKHAAVSAAAVYLIGILVFIGSFYVTIMEDPELQANLALMVAILPAAYFGAFLYYRRGHQTHGFVLGLALFASAIVLDAIITIPVFIMPYGGTHASFFGDPGFWLIGFEYVAAVVAYWQFRVVKSHYQQVS